MRLSLVALLKLIPPPSLPWRLSWVQWGSGCWQSGSHERGRSVHSPTPRTDIPGEKWTKRGEIVEDLAVIMSNFMPIAAVKMPLFMLKSEVFFLVSKDKYLLEYSFKNLLLSHFFIRALVYGDTLYCHAAPSSLQLLNPVGLCVILCFYAGCVIAWLMTLVVLSENGSVMPYD